MTAEAAAAAGRRSVLAQVLADARQRGIARLAAHGEQVAEERVHVHVVQAVLARVVGAKHGAVCHENAAHARIAAIVAVGGAIGRGDDEAALLLDAQLHGVDAAVVAELGGRLTADEHERDALHGRDDYVADASMRAIVEALGHVLAQRDRDVRYAAELDEQCVHALATAATAWLQVDQVALKRPDVSVALGQVVAEYDVLAHVDHAVVAHYQKAEVARSVQAVRLEVGHERAKRLVELAQSHVELGAVEAVLVADGVRLVVVDGHERVVLVQQPAERAVELVVQRRALAVRHGCVEWRRRRRRWWRTLYMMKTKILFLSTNC